MKKLALLALLSSASLVQSIYRQKIDAFSFDTQYGEYPMAYQQFGASIGLKSKMKLIPATTPAYGAIFLNQPIQTPAYEAIFDINIRNKPQFDKELKVDEGFAIWYLHYKPNFPRDFGEIFGYSTLANGLGVFVFRSKETEGQWRMQAVVNDGIDNLSMDNLAKQFQEGKNGCNLKGYQGGKLEISFKVTDYKLDIQYASQSASSTDQGGQRLQCFVSEPYPQLYYQGFFGLTAMNKIIAANDIDLKMVEIYNMDAHYYQDKDIADLYKRNYFKWDHLAESVQGEGASPDIKTLEASAHDLLSLKREMKELENQDIKQNISNIMEGDSFDETVFKIFEQMKGYNNRLAEFNRNQKDLLRDLRDLEKTMQKDSDYEKLKEELAYTETSVLEVEAKLQNLNQDMARIVEQVQQVLYMKTQVKQGNPVEYLMPSAIADSMVQITRGINQLQITMSDFNKVRTDAGNLLQQFLKDLIQFEHHKSHSVELDTFSLSVSKKFDARMDQYEQRVHGNAQLRNWTSAGLTVMACVSVFMVWFKVKSLKRKFLL